jgi:hypothetical protein
MTMNKRSLLGAWVLLWVMALSLLTPCFADQEEENVLYIRTAEQLCQLSQQCTLDSFSQGLTVYLENDIDLTGADFSPIPIFCGVFQGQGHTISGLSITGDGSHLGLFRYLETGAVLRDLVVSGTIAPGGTAQMLGGIVGVNRGTVEGCAFTGSVTGQSSVGGIVGVNEATGLVTQCENLAQITGASYVGGITGRNLGTVSACENRGDINTQYQEQTTQLSLPDLSIDRTDLGVVADVGGIAGQSTGTLLDCQNTGAVGHASQGYNVGGIVGRQSGYVGQCRNEGAVQGRKDVGGIVGQAEPNISIDMDGAVLPALSQELDTLHDLVNDTLSDLGSTSTAVSAGFSAMGTYIYAAAQDASSLASLAQAGVDTILSGLAQYRDQLDYIRDNADLFCQDWADSAQGLSQQIGALLSQLNDTRTDIGKETEPDTDADTDIPLPSPDAAPASDMDTAADTMEPLPADDTPAPAEPEEAPLAADDIETPSADGTGEPVIPVDDELPAESADADESAEASPADDGASESDNIPTQALEALGQLQTSADSLSAYTQSLAEDIQALETWLSSEQIDETELAVLTAALSSHINAALSGASPVLADIAAVTAALAPYEPSMDEDTAALYQALQAAGERLVSLLTDAEALLDSLSPFGQITLPEESGQGAQTLDSMFQNLSNLGSCLSSLNAAVSTGAGALVDDLTAVNDQFQVVMQLVVQALSGEGELDLALFTDQSDTDTQEPSCGKLYACENTGSVQADLDAGGIAGSMGIEYDFDLEGDIFGSDGLSLSAAYLTKCVLRDCESSGNVTARNDNVGGVVGLMDLGTVWACRGYGDICSTDGDYVGGIAGQSLGTIRNCYALCTLSGGTYVGGIAGCGQRLYDDRAMVSLMRWEEQAGAIAGAIADDGECTGSLFVDNGLGGIDGISYAGQAEPVDYETLIALEDTPAVFSSLTITLLAQGQTVAVIPFSYGQGIDPSELPDPPALEGYTGVWEAYDWSCLTFPASVSAVYTAYGATIAADTLRPNDTSSLALFLAEGSFYPEAALTVTESADVPPLEPEQQALESCHITITGAVDEEDSFTLRYRLPDADGTLTLYRQEPDGTWQAVDYERDGRYAVLSLDSSTALLCAVQSPAQTLWLWLGTGAALILLAAVGLTIGLRRRKRAAQTSQ